MLNKFFKLKLSGCLINNLITNKYETNFIYKLLLLNRSSKIYKIFPIFKISIFKILFTISNLNKFSFSNSKIIYLKLFSSYGLFKNPFNAHFLN